MYSEKEFRKLRLEERYKLLKSAGDYVGVRTTPSHRVYLFIYNGYYVELWQIITLNQVQWIEIQSNQQILSEYIKDVDLSDLW